MNLTEEFELVLLWGRFVCWRYWWLVLDSSFL